MRSRPGSHTTARHVVSAVTVAVALIGCTADPPPEPDGVRATTPDASSPSPTITQTRSPTSPSDRAQQQAVAAYLAMWRDVAAAAETSDWRAPRLADHAEGDALEALSRSLYADHRNGLVTRGEPKNDPEVASVEPSSDPSTVLIDDCGDSTTWLKYDAETGEQVDAEAGGRRAITAEVIRQSDGSWKVTRFAVEAVGTC